MSKIIEKARKIAKNNGVLVNLPELEINQECQLKDVWDGNGEIPFDDETCEGSYSYELGNGDFIDYDFVVLGKCEDELEHVIRIINIWIG